MATKLPGRGHARIDGYRLAARLPRPPPILARVADHRDADGLLEFQFVRAAERDRDAVMERSAALRRLRHPHLLPVAGAGFHDELPYLVRPLVLGRSLAETLARGALPQPVALAVLHAVALAVAALHAEGPDEDWLALGGVASAAVWLGFSGEVFLVPLGLPAGVRSAARDLTSLRRWNEALLTGAGAHASARDPLELAAALRRSGRMACADRSALVARLLRTRFRDELAEERHRFGLLALH